MPVVSNTGPLLAFARAGRLGLLREVVRELIIPDAVYKEIVVHGAGRAGAEEVQEGSWIKRESLRNREVVDQLPQRLDLGEREALALAMEFGAALLVDDLEARKEALLLGIPFLGSLRVLKEAKGRGVIPAVKPALDDLIAAGIYVSDSLYERFLRDLGEALV
ncbi:MAG: DUF3368 domain-containing protein [Chloroflexi bacterium]|nr:DUF3368 domain-containing protein [Chloroflexota bacterium]